MYNSSLLSLQLNLPHYENAIFKTSFEFIFSLMLAAILGLPPVLIAQNQKPVQKDMEISITNGDTVVNGKKISQLSADDRIEAMKDIRHIETPDSAGAKGMRMQFHNRRKMVMMRDTMANDSNAHNFRFKKRLPQMVNRMNFNMPDMRMPRRNTENFDFVSTDNDGISTHVRFRISDASDIDLKRTEHVEGPRFEIKDLSIVPLFATGKTMLMFSLPAKIQAMVKLSDSQGKLLWSEKAAGGNFTKAFPLNLNGIYFLQVKQGNAYCVKRIMKEE